MELRSLQSPTITGIPSGRTQSSFKEKLFVSGQGIKIPNLKCYPDARKLKFGVRAQASGTTKFRSEAAEAVPKDANIKDDNLVFVAGATGRVGSRTVRELLKLGFKVRAGVRSAQRAESLLQSVRQLKLGAEVAIEGTKPIEMLEIVECDLEKREQIGRALGNASVVICCIGASEKEVFDITGPYRIDYVATKNLIDAATVAKVNHFILLTSLGTNKVGFPAAILNLFWGVLIWKRKAEEALLASGLPYTIVRPGGMERPTDAYKETHNITLSEEDTLFGGQVSNLQVAELMAFMAKERSLSYCKVVEVIAETTAPLKPMDDLLVKIPSQRAEVKPLKKSDAAIKPPGAASEVVSEPSSLPVEKEPAKAKTTAIRPLSPYFVYEDLKPPTSPTQTTSTSAGATQDRNKEAIPAASESVPSSIQTNISELESTDIEEEAVQTEVIKRPLSPYTAYEDLKPPTSPSPISSGPKEVTLSAPTAEVVPESTTLSAILTGNDAAKITMDIGRESMKGFSSHQSPYLAYEDLKPPTSPSPTPSGPKEVTFSTSTAEVVSVVTPGNDVSKITTTSAVERDPPQGSNSYQSPYHAYDDLKPPTSPSPSAPTGSLLPLSIEPAHNTAQDLPAAKPQDEHHNVQPKPRPLSPFTMYEDLKPPTSPVPSPRK